MNKYKAADKLSKYYPLSGIDIISILDAYSASGGIGAINIDMLGKKLCQEQEENGKFEKEFAKRWEESKKEHQEIKKWNEDFEDRVSRRFDNF